MPEGEFDVSVAARATGSPGAPTAGTYAGLFMVTLSTLMYEIILTRIFSVTMYYHFAFVAISIALFGMTLGALIVYLRPERFPHEDVRRQLWLYALLFSVSIALSFLTQMAVPFVPRWNLVGVWSVVLTCVVIAVPFTFSGIVVCLALTRFPARVSRLYAADLAGAALGCILLVLLMSRLDGPSAVIAIGALAGFGALAFAWDGGLTRGMWVALAAVFVLGGIALMNARLAERRDPFLYILWAKEGKEQKYPYEKWNAFSRVTVTGDPDAGARPYGWGMSNTLPDDIFVNQLTMTIDGGAATVLTRYTGKEKETDFLRYDVTNLVHYIRQPGDVLVIGVGGGRDLLSAIEFDQNSVTGVEINKQILDTTNVAFGDFTGHLDRHPKVKLVNDEARSYLTRTDNEYDVIQISLIDTWAATAAGAYSLTENSLYTTEAWDTFMDRLKPGGVLSVSRWYNIGDDEPLEMYRTAALAAHALKERGVENPRDHMLIYAGDYATTTPSYSVSAATLLVSPEPFTADDIARMDEATKQLEFGAVLTRTEAADPRFAGLASPEGPDATIDSFEQDISPPTDDRPFFFQMTGVKSFFNGSAFENTHVTRPALVLAILGLVVLGMTTACIIVPMLAMTERSAHAGMAPFYTYFSGIGIGFMMVEVSQLQRLSIFLGHPTYALTVVLFSVLLASGIGSMVTERIVRPEKAATLLAPLAALLLVVVLFGAITPGVIDRFDADTTPARIMAAVGLLFPLGLVMGMPFAIGMSMAGTRSGAPTPFLWGINGATSVCASVLAMVVAMLWGISVSYWLGALAYGAAFAAMALLATRAGKAEQSAAPVAGADPAPERAALS